MYPEVLQQLIEAFKILPGVGEKTAERYALSLLDIPDEEIENICKAQRIAEAALKHILGFIKIGVTEKEIALELDHYMLSHGAEALSFETIAIGGANTSKPHGVPTEKKIEDGDFVTMDYGAVVNG